MHVQSQEIHNAISLNGLMLQEALEEAGVQKEGLAAGETGVEGMGAVDGVEDEAVQAEGGEEEEALLLEDVGAHLVVEEEVVSKCLQFAEHCQQCHRQLVLLWSQITSNDCHMISRE